MDNTPEEFSIFEVLQKLTEAADKLNLNISNRCDGSPFKR